MKLVLTSPTHLRINEPANRLVLAADLKYKDRRAEYDYKRLLHNRFLRSKYGEEKFQEELAKIKANIHNSLLMEDDYGSYTYSGLANRLITKFHTELENEVLYPEPKLIPWEHVPKRPLREYQKNAVEKLLEARHAAIEVSTGGGKTRIALQLAKELGLQMVVTAPTTNIADQILAEFIYHFGRKYVGQFYGGKKQLGKLFTIAISASLIRVKKKTEEWDFFSKTKVCCFDESHLIAADTLSRMALDLFQNAPYRFSISATQMRSDGLDLLLEAITGPVVYRKTLQELVDEEYLAKPRFNIVQVPAHGTRMFKDPMKTTQHHLYYNPHVNRTCGELVNKCVATGYPTLILVDEIEQFTELLPHLRYEAKFAHGGVTKANSDKLPKEYHKVVPSKLVKEFNEGKFPILVGTSCVSIGTDFQAVGAIHYLMGGTSEIQTSQAVGRGTRGGAKGHVFMSNGKQKTDFLFFDYDVAFWDSEEELLTHRHAIQRRKIYDSLYGPVNTIKIR